MEQEQLLHHELHNETDESHEITDSKIINYVFMIIPATFLFMNCLLKYIHRHRVSDTGYINDETRRRRIRLRTKPTLQKIKYRPEQSYEECSVCLEQFITEEEVVSLQCSHIFHEKCITLWFQKQYSCPLCRTNDI